VPDPEKLAGLRQSGCHHNWANGLTILPLKGLDVGEGDGDLVDMPCGCRDADGDYTRLLQRLCLIQDHILRNMIRTDEDIEGVPRFPSALGTIWIGSSIDA
jgi:hypothetical protein|tara:strand:- start:44 stop:346 length:303 start_codon:yes stop_codon:yes gene_type:complete